VTARVLPRVWPCGICGGQSGAGAGFLRVLRFTLPILIPPISPQFLRVLRFTLPILIPPIAPQLLRVLRFTLPIFIPPIAPQSPSSIIWGWYNSPVVAAVQMDSVTPH
jgi:hypothetical protein